MKKREIIIFGIIFLLSFAAILIMQFVPSGDTKTVLITIDGEEYRRIVVDENTYETFIIETEHGFNEVVIENGSVDVVSSDCPNQICVNTKKADNQGDLIVCLPHKVVIEIMEE